jgi:hypothetical protein
LSLAGSLIVTTCRLRLGATGGTFEYKEAPMSSIQISSAENRLSRQAGAKFALEVILALGLGVISAGPAVAQETKPNILFIMGDDIGWMQPRIYHRGLMVGETPNIDRIGKEGAIFMDYVAMQS